jgi:DNA-binding SARP family transcriptional activator/TolB-like protein
MAHLIGLMLRIYLFGQLELGSAADASQTSILAQPKRLAFLAYLAVTGGKYHRRDTLLALFWPELNALAARRALRNTLYQLRLTLGDEVFLVRGDDEVAVNSAILWCDVAALKEAVAAERYDEAVSLYRGELLDGFHLTNAGEGFEGWLSRERALALSLALQALDAQVTRFERAGDSAAAAQCAVRATAIAPFDEVWLRRAAIALDAVGDRSGAVRLADAFVQRMATELEARPSSETVELIERLRSGSNDRMPRRTSPAEPPRATASPANPAASDVFGDRAAYATTGGTAGAGPSPAPSIEVSRVMAATDLRSWPRRHSRWWRSWPVGAFVAVALAVAGWVAVTQHRHNAPQARERVLVTLFNNRTGDTTLNPLGDMVVDWLARGLVRSQLADVVDPRALRARGRTLSGQPDDPAALARRVGAVLVVAGSYYRSGDSLLFVAGIVDGDGRVLRTVGPLAASLAHPVDGVEATRARVMTALASIVDVRSRGDWNIHAPPPPFEAYEPYMAGWDFFWSNQFSKAESLFALAATRDTTFDGANVAVATAAANILRCGIVDSVVRSLDRRGRSLNEPDALNVRIAVARCHGRNDEMMQLAIQRARALSPTSPTQVSTANAALWANHPAGAVAILERLNPAVDLDWMPMPDHLDYWASLTEGYHMIGRYDAELAATNRGDMVGLGRALYRGRALVGLERSADALAGLDSAFAMPAEPGLSSGMAPNTDGRAEYTGTAAWVGLWLAHELDVHGDSAAGRAAAIRTLAWLDRLPRPDRETPEMRFFAMQFLEQAGRTADAMRVAERLVAEDSANVDYRGLMAGLAVESGDTALAGRLDMWLAALPPERALWGASFYRARAASLRGRAAEAVGLVRETLARGAWPYWIHADPALHRLAGRPDYLTLMAPRP